MNYYPFHIGDYASATRHLSWDEDAAYRRLLDVYYTTEKPIPLDERQAFRLVGAQTETQREAVKVVLNEFFEFTSEGWKNRRADAVIAEMKARQQKQREKANKRWHKPRTDSGIAPAMPQHTENDAAALNSDAVAMPPKPKPKPKDVNPLSDQRALTALTVSAREEPPPRALDAPPPESHPKSPTPAALLAKAMRQAGIEAQPADPRIIALANRGVSAETVSAAAAEAKSAKPGERIPVGYVVSIVERWAKAAAGICASHVERPLARASPRFGNDARSEDRKRAYEALTGRKAPRIEDSSHDSSRIIDVTPTATSLAFAVG